MLEDERMERDELSPMKLRHCFYCSIDTIESHCNSGSEEVTSSDKELIGIEERRDVMKAIPHIIAKYFTLTCTPARRMVVVPFCCFNFQLCFTLLHFFTYAFPNWHPHLFFYILL